MPFLSASNASRSRGSLNLTIEEGGNAVPGSVQDTDEILADCERVISRWHDRREGSMTQVALAPCAPFNATKRLLTETASLATRHDCRMHTHLGETRHEVAYCQEKFSCRPVDYFEEVGWMSDRAWVAHGIHFNDDEIRRLGRAGVGVCHYPTSNMVLSSGQCRTKELEAISESSFESGINPE